MTTLQNIARFITQGHVSEKEAYEILSDYTSRESQKAWVRGWNRRNNLARGSKAAKLKAEIKNNFLDSELNSYINTDYTKPLASKALIALEEDIVEVEHLKRGDTVVIKKIPYKILEVYRDENKILLKF